MMKLSLVALDREIFVGDVLAVFAKSSEGAFEVRPGHSPMLAALVEADFYYDTAVNERQGLFLYGGVLEVIKNEVIVIADEVNLVDELDPSHVESRISKLQEEIKASDVDYAAALRELSMMTAQLNMLRKIKKYR